MRLGEVAHGAWLVGLAEVHTEEGVLRATAEALGLRDHGALVPGARADGLLLPDLEPRCEDYGQVATYLGGVPGAEAVLWLDDHHAFEVGRPERVCGNTADMLTRTRFAPFFRVTDRGWQAPVAVGGVIGRWAAVVGEEIAAHCHPETFSDGVLTVRADSTSTSTTRSVSASSTTISRRTFGTRSMRYSVPRYTSVWPP